MPSEDFPNAPDMGQEFGDAKQFQPEKEPQQKAAPQRYSELDHHDLSSLDYTPGGSLEQDVHTQLSGNARREYNERMQREQPQDEQHYLDQVQDKFDKQIQEAEKKHEAEHSEPTQSERPNDHGQQKSDERTGEEKGQQPTKQQRPDYEMDSSEKDSGSIPPPAWGKPKQYGRNRLDRDRSDDGHEH